MKLHQDRELFREAIEAAAQHFQLRPVFVEKDYWVTYVLRNLALSPYVNTVVFKGGTSLSKAYQCIDRFSEDIDLAILSPGNYSGNQLKNLLKEVTTAIVGELSIVDGHPAEKKSGRMRAAVCTYEKVLDGDFGVVKDYVLIEINCFTDPVPYQALPVSSYIAQFFLTTGKQDMITNYHLEPIIVNVLTLERTFFEKMLSLNRLSYEGRPALLEKIRHFYDLHQLFHYPALQAPLFDPAHFPILDHVRRNDLDNKEMHGIWVGQRIQDSPLFGELEAQWRELMPGYRTGLADLIWTGKLPSPEAVLTVLQGARAFVIAFDEKYPP
ncbi:MAG TPA: nucleotidyl transferase AbiEii/AbiGii toxin family protein [Puia sp.]